MTVFVNNSDRIVPKRLRKGEPWPKDIKVVEARTLRQALDGAMVSE